MSSAQPALLIPDKALADFCERHHIRRVWLYGSALRADFAPDSDVDLLVEFDPAHIPGWEFYTWGDELAAIFGRPVDLGTPDALRPWLREHILQTAQVIYERA